MAIDEMGRDDLRRRAKAMLAKNGWKPGDQFSAHSTVELMVALATDAVRTPPDRCAYPECGCCHDAICGDAPLAYEAARPVAGAYGGPPNGYHPLPAGEVCKCVKLWTDGKGNHWCCQPIEASPVAPMSTSGEMVEIWNGDRKVTIYPDTVIRVWGPNMTTEMSDEPRSHEAVNAAVAWLYASRLEALEALVAEKEGERDAIGVRAMELTDEISEWRARAITAEAALAKDASPTPPVGG